MYLCYLSLTKEFIVFVGGACGKLCLSEGILRKQCALEVELVLTCSLFLECQIVMEYRMVPIVVYVVFCSKWMARFRPCRSASKHLTVTEFLMYKNYTPSKFTSRYWLFMVKILST